MSTVMTSREQKNNLISSILPDNWQEQYGASFSEDDLIDAYQKGKAEERTSQQKILYRAFQNNINTAISIAEEFINEINSSNVKLEDTYLKINSFDKFALLFVIGEDDFISDKFLDIIGIAENKKTFHESETFNINFNFTYQSESLSSTCLAADGFNARYAGTRKA